MAAATSSPLMADAWDSPLNYEEGYEAGLRGDQLVSKKNQAFMAGYEAGLTAREQTDCGCVGLQHRRDCPQWILPI